MTTALSLVLTTLALLRAEPPAELGERPSCLVAEGLQVAEVTLAGVDVRARDGALQIGARTITPCDGLPGPHPTALAVTGDVLWIGFRAAGLHRWTGDRFERVEGLGDRAVRALEADGEAVWVGTDRGLLRALGTRAKRTRHFVLGRREITGLRLAGDGALHVGAGPYGWWRQPRGREARRVERHVFAGCFEETGGVVRPLPPGRACGQRPAPSASGLPSAHVTALATHRGRLYVGTFDGGLAVAEGDRFRAVEGAPRFVNALLDDGEALWIGSPRGLYAMRHGSVRRSAAGLPSPHVNGLARGTDGTIWVATGGGLVGLGPRGVRVLDETSGLPARIVYAVAVTADGAVWAGTAGGVARLTDAGIGLYTHARGQLPHDWVNALLADGDGVLAGTYDAGVARLTPDGGGRLVEGLEAAWVNPGGLAWVGGRLTVATLGGGLLVADEDGVAHQPGLPSEDVTAVVRHAGSHWIGTRGGLARL